MLVLRLTPVGVRGWRIERGEVGVVSSELDVDVIIAAERGFFESLSWQASLQ